MDIRSRIKHELRKRYGNFETYLESKYEDILTDKLLSSKKLEWSTYNQVVLELKHSLNDQLRVKELQYWLTDSDNPTQSCLNVLENVFSDNAELRRLYEKITNFD